MGVSLRKQKEESISGRKNNRTIGKRRHFEPQDLKYPGWLENGGKGQETNKPYEVSVFFPKSNELPLKGFWADESKGNETMHSR